MASPLIAKYQPTTTTPAKGHKENVAVVKAAQKSSRKDVQASATIPAAPPPWSIGGKR